MEKDVMVKKLASRVVSTSVGLGAALTEVAGIQTFVDAQNKLFDAAFRPQSGELGGKGLKAYPSIIGPTAHALEIPLRFHTVTDERIECSTSKCSYYETAKQLGFADTPLCEGLCKAVSDSLLRLIAPECSKRIVKSLWKGDDECCFEIARI